ncbi:carboxylesterase [Dacryopinax primogenitus]|uniref:Carboxylic ester hydrolase n=1 Tax=Dacryopinax primogenitus (strain DJM 731) TaxID=1858805 RepID=M5GDH9_DACPD|nr:carboxylesterase [Dacryopinax primogenitus]EJU02413.1 carboxylesterase [Dacryopinax primogenitus]
MLSLSVAFLALSAHASPIFSRDDGTLVTTAQGAVQGTLVTPTVRQWLGIPYAAPPTGTSRFAAPQPAPSWSSTLSASAFGNSCPSVLDTEFLTIIGLLQQQESIAYDEDCLNLNIWAPATSRPQGGAVMLWVYGGGDMFGSSNTPYYSGTTFVEDHDDLVIVTFNYRMDIFGFPNAPQQLTNVGLLDLDAAIQWVYANIAAFGGDPERITIFGESAGALAVDAYAFSHPTDTVVKGIIAESGTAQLTSILQIGSTSPSETNSSWNTVANALGCGTAGDAAQLACMQAVPWQTLLSEVVSGGESFTPYPDGQTIFSDVSTRSSNGEFLKVPFLVGNNANEGDIFAVAFEEGDFGNTIPVATTVLSDAVTEVVFLCPASKAANDRTNAGVATWRYRFEGVYLDATNNNADLRAFHTVEVPMVFGTYNLSTFSYAPVSNEIALSAWMQSAWVTFAQNPVSGLSSYGWTQYSTNILSSTIARLGNSDNPSGATYSPPIDFDVGCGAVNALTPYVIDLIDDLGSIF